MSNKNPSLGCSSLEGAGDPHMDKALEELCDSITDADEAWVLRSLLPPLRCIIDNLIEQGRAEQRMEEPATSIKALQHKHDRFIREMGWRNSKTPLEATALICEEIGELTHELRQPTINRGKAGREIADIILRAIDLACELEFDIESFLVAKVDENLANIEHHKAKGRKV